MDTNITATVATTFTASMSSEMALEDTPTILACMLLGEIFKACCRSAGPNDGFCALVECINPEACEIRDGCGCNRVEDACGGIKLEADLAKMCQAADDCCEDSLTLMGIETCA